MKLSLLLLTLVAAAASASAAVTPQPDSDSAARTVVDVEIPQDSFESGLENLNDRSHQRRAAHKRGKKKSWVSKWGRVTWYGGGQLDNPACGGSVHDNDNAAAVHPNSGMGKCGDTIHLHWKGRMVPVTIRDYCAGCKWGAIDVTKSVFRKLDGSLDAGVLTGNGLHFRMIEH